MPHWGFVKNTFLDEDTLFQKDEKLKPGSFLKLYFYQNQIDTKSVIDLLKHFKQQTSKR